MGIIAKFISIYFALMIFVLLIDLPNEKQGEDETKKSTENGGKKFVKVNDIDLAEV